MSTEDPGIICIDHGMTVELAKGSPEIIHEDGSHCNSTEFDASLIERPQVMALLILSKGWDVAKAVTGYGGTG